MLKKIHIQILGIMENLKKCKQTDVIKMKFRASYKHYIKAQRITKFYWNGIKNCTQIWNYICKKKKITLTFCDSSHFLIIHCTPGQFDPLIFIKLYLQVYTKCLHFIKVFYSFWTNFKIVSSILTKEIILIQKKLFKQDRVFKNVNFT